jgi:hypothetical protein
MTDEMAKLHAYLQSKYESEAIDFAMSPSGSATLEMRVNDLLLIFEYSPQEGFGVSRVDNIEDAWDPNKCVVFGKDEFKEARDYFLSLIEN